MPMYNERIKKLNNNSIICENEYILYWMQAAVRVDYNYALDYAINIANELKKPLIVFFGLTSTYPEANLRHYYFLIEGLLDVKKSLNNIGIQFFCKLCNVPDGVIEIAKNACVVICDRGYLKIQKKWCQLVALNISCAMFQVETESVVPVNLASNKEEVAARTIRPKILNNLNKFLVPFSLNKIFINSLNLTLNSQIFNFLDNNSKQNFLDLDKCLIDEIIFKLNVDKSVLKSPYFSGGEKEANKILDIFLKNKLEGYNKFRNDPTKDYLSNLSPYLHFGQISPVKIALKVNNSCVDDISKKKFLDELIIRRELAFNLCEYNEKYDSIEALPNWALISLREGEKDERKYIYNLSEFEFAKTHDHYWNAAQLQMLITGKMHGYMRMYWGKKVIEWTKNIDEAFKILVYLNNKYSLDGHDPLSYAGILWCFGKHDRPWIKRKIFGSVRYMNDEGLKRKFDANLYVKQIASLCSENNYKLESLTYLLENNKNNK